MNLWAFHYPISTFSPLTAYHIIYTWTKNSITPFQFRLCECLSLHQSNECLNAPQETMGTFVFDYYLLPSRYLDTIKSACAYVHAGIQISFCFHVILLHSPFPSSFTLNFCMKYLTDTARLRLVC